MSTGGGSASVHAGIYPPGADIPPGADPPGAPPPPGTRPLPGKQTPAYGQRAAGTHPTGMHSCSLLSLEATETFSSKYWTFQK